MQTMEALQFRTNIKCSGCVAQVTPALNETVGSGNWSVDIANPDKILTISSHKENQREIKRALEKAGFKAEVIS
jgi:copper chaperone CopZ